MAYGNFKDVNRRKLPNNILRDNAFNIAKDKKIMDINVDLVQWFKNVLLKKLLVVVLKMKIFLIKNQKKNYRNQLLKT